MTLTLHKSRDSKELNYTDMVQSGTFLCKKKGKEKRISHGAQTEIMHVMKHQEKELGIKLSWEHREYPDWH